MWPVFLKRGIFLQVWFIFASVTHFCNRGLVWKCNPIFQRWLIYSRVTHFSMFELFVQMWLTFPILTYFYKSDPSDSVLQVSPIFKKLIFSFSRANHFSKRSSFYVVWPIFPSVTRICKRDPHFSVTNFSKCEPAFQVRSIFPTLTHVSKYEPLVQGDTLVQVLPTFGSVTHFFMCDPLL